MAQLPAQPASKAVRTHFSSSHYRRLPEYLFYRIYVDVDGILRPSRAHIAGQVVSSLDVRYWFDFGDAISRLIAKNGSVDTLIASGSSELNNVALERICDHLVHTLKSIDISYCFNLLGDPNRNVAFTLCRLQSLTELNLAGNNNFVDDVAIATIVQHLTNLTALNISDCYHLSDAALISVSNSLAARSMVSLRADNNQLFTFKGANEVALKCELLEFVSFSGCQGLKFYGVVVRGPAGLLNVSRKLKEAVFDNCSDLAPQAFDWICTGNQSLESLSIANGRNINESTVQGIFQACPNITSMNVSGCISVTGVAVLTVSSLGIKLKKLNISRLSPNFHSKEATELLVRLHNLVELDISGNKGILDSTFADIGGGGGTEFSAIALQKAVAEKSAPGTMKNKKSKRIPSVSNGSYAGCWVPPKLRWLSVRDTGLTSFGVACLAERCTELYHLDISGLPDVTDAAVSVIAGCCRKIRELWMDDCDKLTDRSVVEVCYAFKYLSSLHLSSSKSLHKSAEQGLVYHRQYTDDSMEAILDGARYLLEVTLCNQNSITLESPWLIHNLPKRAGHFTLRRIDLRGADFINLSGAAIVFSNCWDLSEVLLSERVDVQARSREFRQVAFPRAPFAMSYDDTVAVNRKLRANRKIKDTSIVMHEDELLDSSEVNSVDGSSSLMSNMTGPNSVSMLSSGTRSVQSLLQALDTANLQLGKAKIMRRGEKPPPAVDVFNATETYFYALHPHQEEKILRFRDAYCRRRLLELFAVGIIRMAWKVHVFWSKVRYKINARKIAYWYKYFLAERCRVKKILFLTRNNQAKLIQRLVRRTICLRIYSSRRIQACARGWLARRVFRRRRGILLSAVRIQAWTRGWLARLTDKLLLARVYLNLPPFWKMLVQDSPDFEKLNPKNIPSLIEAREAKAKALVDRRKRRGKEEEVIAPALTVEQREQRDLLAGLEARRRRIYPYQIEDLKIATKQMRDKIKDHILPNGSSTTGKVPFFVPQPFDKKPYMSLTDGRKLEIHSAKEGLIAIQDVDFFFKNKKDKEKMKLLHGGAGKPSGGGGGGGGGGSSSSSRSTDLATLPQPPSPVHKFSLVFWPLTTPLEKLNDSSTLLHDTHVFGHDLAEYEENSYTLFCEQCERRLRMVQCKTCECGYCFFCAFSYHSVDTKRHHQMEIIEPRVVCEKKPAQSLIYHIDMAKKASHDLGFLVKYLKSGNEVKRIQEERKLKKKFEEEEELRRIAMLKAMEENREKHNAADKIAFLYRRWKARQVVTEKRAQLRLQEAIVTAENSERAWIRVQKLFRQHSTMKWFATRGVKFHRKRTTGARRRSVFDSTKTTPGGGGAGKKTGDMVTKEELDFRMGFEIQQRRVVNRSQLVHLVKEKYSLVKELLEVNIRSWERREAIIPAQEEKLLEQWKKYKEVYATKGQELAEKKESMSVAVYSHQEKLLRAWTVPIYACEKRMDNLRNMRFWVLQLLRSLYRRKASFEVRYPDTENRLQWVGIESGLISRIEWQLSSRIDMYKTKLRNQTNTALVIEWLRRHLDYAETLQAAFDSQQESILLEELTRLRRDEFLTTEFDSLMEEMYGALVADNQITSERVNLDKRTITLTPGSEEAVRVSEQLLLLKQKQLQLANNVIDTLKAGLGEKLRDEEEKSLEIYGFEDDPTYTIADLPKIKAILLEPFKPVSHFKLNDFMCIYYSQPWISEEAVKDVRIEEEIKSCELNLGKMKLEMAALDATLVDGQSGVKELLIKINTIKQQIEIHENSDTTTGNIEIDKLDAADRKDQIINLSGELRRFEAEHTMAVRMQERTKGLQPPLQDKMSVVGTQQLELQERLQRRLAERERFVGLFFDTEEKFNTSMVDTVKQAHIDLLARKSKLSESRLHAVAAQNSAFDYVKKIDSDKLSLEERNHLEIPYEIGRQTIRQHASLQMIKPRLVGHPGDLLKTSMHLLERCLDLDISVLEATAAGVEREFKMMEEFPKMRPDFEKSVQLIKEWLLEQRRQKAIQRELDERKARLDEMREIRNKLIKGEVERQQADDQKAKEERSEAERERLSKPSVAKIVGETVKKNYRAAKDFFRDMRHKVKNRMDEEEQAMANAVKHRTKDQLKDTPQGIRSLHITCGKEELELFQRLNDHLKSKGLSYHTMLPRHLGTDQYLWIETTFDSSEFITTLEISHGQPGHELNRSKELTELGEFEVTKHDKLKLELWVERDGTKTKGIDALQITHIEQEEVRAIVDGWEKIEQQLSLYGVAGEGVHLWYRKIEKARNDGIPTAAGNVNSLVSEAMKIKALIKKDPENEVLQKRSLELAKEIEEAYKKEEESKDTTVLEQNPLESAIELLALSKDEMETFIKFFKRVDKDRVGRIKLKKLFTELEVLDCAFSRELFTSMDALDNDGSLEFGDFMKVVSTVGLFGKEEMLRTIYSFADTDKIGFVSTEQYTDLLNVLHPVEKRRAKLALLNMALTPGQMMTFPEFAEYNDRFPNNLFPAMHVQGRIRENIMGSEWWVKKLMKYKGVRSKITDKDSVNDKRRQLEIERFNEDVEKEQRLKKRAEEIMNTNSAVRKTILEARQIVDELF